MSILPPPPPGIGRRDTVVVRRLAANSSWQVASFACRAVAGLGVVIVLARAHGPQKLGVFQFALTLTSLLPYYWGLPALLSREVARRPETARPWIESGMVITLGFGMGFSALLAGGSRLLGASPATVRTIDLASMAMIVDGIARVHFAAFIAWERMRLETIATAIQEATFFAAAALAIALGGGPVEAMIAFLGSRLLGTAIAWDIASRRVGGPLLLRTHGTFARRAARASASFAASDTLGLVQMRGDSVLLGMMKGPTAVGLYQACTNLVLYWNVLARSLNHAVYPRMSRAWPARADRFARYRDASNRSLALIGVPVAVGGALLAAELLHTLYGPRFAPAAWTLRLIVLVIPIRMMSNTLSLSLAAANRQPARTRAIGAAATANIALNLALIPRWSYLGSAVATVITETALLTTYAALLRPMAGPSHLLRAVSLPAVASMPMALAVLATSAAPIAVPVLAGGAAYGAALAAIAMVRFRDRTRSPAAALIGLVRPV